MEEARDGGAANTGYPEVAGAASGDKLRASERGKVIYPVSRITLND